MLRILLFSLVLAAAAAEDAYDAHICNDRGQCCTASGVTVSDPTFKCTAVTTSSTETFTLHPGPYVVPGNSMMLKVELALGNREFEIPVYAYGELFFKNVFQANVSAFFAGNFMGESGEYKIQHPSNFPTSQDIKICDSKNLKCCTTSSFPGSCAIDSDTVVTLDKVGFHDAKCGDAYSYYFFGKRELSSGKSFKLCAFGDPQVYYTFGNAGDWSRNISSTISIDIKKSSM